MQNIISFRMHCITDHINEQLHNHPTEILRRLYINSSENKSRVAYRVSGEFSVMLLGGFASGFVC